MYWAPRSTHVIDGGAHPPARQVGVEIAPLRPRASFTGPPSPIALEDRAEKYPSRHGSPEGQWRREDRTSSLAAPPGLEHPSGEANRPGGNVEVDPVGQQDGQARDPLDARHDPLEDRRGIADVVIDGEHGSWRP